VGQFDPEAILRALSKHRVQYILIGATAARLQGFPRLTADADITPATDAENLKRLSSALRDLHARVYTESLPEGLPFSWDAPTLARAKLWDLVTDAGRLDLVFTPSGTEGYDDLARSAISFQVFDLEVRAAHLEDILRSKAASNRPQDQQDVVLIKQMLKHR
jgi:hypothetical protein